MSTARRPGKSLERLDYNCMERKLVLVSVLVGLGWPALEYNTNVSSVAEHYFIRNITDCLRSRLVSQRCAMCRRGDQQLSAGTGAVFVWLCFHQLIHKYTHSTYCQDYREKTRSSLVLGQIYNTRVHSKQHSKNK